MRYLVLRAIIEVHECHVRRAEHHTALVTIGERPYQQRDVRVGLRRPVRYLQLRYSIECCLGQRMPLVQARRLPYVVR